MSIWAEGIWAEGIWADEDSDGQLGQPGGIDPVRKGRKQIHLPFKPTGLVNRPLKEGQKEVEDRVNESRSIQAEIAGKLAREFTEESERIEVEAAPPPISLMTQAEISREVGVRLRKKLQDDEDLIVIMTMLAHIV